MKEGRRLRQPLLFALRYQPAFMNFMSDGLSVVFWGQALQCTEWVPPQLNGVGYWLKDRTLPAAGYRPRVRNRAA